MGSSRKGLEYSLQVKGLMGRDKKLKAYYFTILEIEGEEKATEQQLEYLVAQKCLEARYKYGALVVIEYPTRYDDTVRHSNSAHRRKTVEMTKGEVVWRRVGYNAPVVVVEPKKVEVGK